MVVGKPSVVEDMNTNEASLWLEEVTGIHVNYEQLPLENMSLKAINISLNSSVVLGYSRFSSCIHWSLTHIFRARLQWKQGLISGGGKAFRGGGYEHQ